MTTPRRNKQAPTPEQKEIAAAMRKTSVGYKATPEPNAAVRAVIAKLSKSDKNNMARALKSVSSKQNVSPSNIEMKSVLAKALKNSSTSPGARVEMTGTASNCPAFRPNSLADALQQIAADQKKSRPTPTLGHRLGLKVSAGSTTFADAQRAAFRAGVVRGIREASSLNLNPWLQPVETLQNPANEALKKDWDLIVRDLWISIEKVTQQLEDLPPQTRVRLARSLAHYLQSHAGS